MLRHKLTKKEKKMVQKWLGFSEELKLKRCPFFAFFEIEDNICICESWFPRTKRKRRNRCPCSVYSLKYVIRKAQEMIK